MFTKAVWLEPALRNSRVPCLNLAQALYVSETQIDGYK